MGLPLGMGRNRAAGGCAACGGQYGCRASEQATGHTGQYGSLEKLKFLKLMRAPQGDNLISPDKPAEGWRQSG